MQYTYLRIDYNSVFLSLIEFKIALDSYFKSIETRHPKRWYTKLNVKSSNGIRTRVINV